MGKHAFRGRIGLFLLVLMLASGGVTSVSAAPQAFPAVATPTYAPSQIQKFGLETNIGTRFGRLGQMQQPMDLAQRTNAGLILEQMKWEFVEQPVCGQYRWDFYDELVTQARAHGLEIMAQIGYNNIACQLGQEDRGVPDFGRWKNFVTALVTRYKGDVHKWEIWNEPDNPEFWKGTPQQFVALVQLTYQTIKAIDPTAQVSAGACSQLDLVICDQLIAAGILNFSDSFGFHPYIGKDNFDNGLFKKIDLPHLRDRQRANGNKPIRLTESGWSSANPGAAGNAVGSLQGRYMVEQIVTMLGFTDLNIDQVIWYDFRDDGAPGSDAPVRVLEVGAPGTQPPRILATDGDGPETENHFGLVQNDWQTPKPSFTAFQQMSAHLAGGLAQGLVDRGDGGTAYRFNRNGTMVDVVWGGGRTSLATDAREAQAYDLSGNPLPTDMSDGKIHVDIGDDPVYIEHSKKAYGPLAAGSAPVASSGSPTTSGAGSPPGTSTTASVSPQSNPTSGSPVVNTQTTSPNAGGNPIVSGSGAPSGGPVVAGSGAGSGVWTDPEQRVRLQYPSGWAATSDSGIPFNVLILNGPDGVQFYVNVFDQTGSPDAIVGAVKQVHQQSPSFFYADNFVLDATVGGEAGKVLNYGYSPKNDTTSPPRTGKLWIVTHGGKEFDFEVRNLGGHGGDADVLIASVVFPR